MSPVLAVLFWGWLLVSVVILVRRRMNRPVELTEDATLAPGPEAELDPSPAEARVHASIGADGPTPSAAPAPIPDPAPAQPLPGFEPLPVTAPVLDRPAPRSAPAAGIADALVGIRMPCDLVPLVLDRLASDRITLSTTGHGAEEVGTALADEIERLGYGLTPVGERELLATRGATELSLSIQAPDANGRHAGHPSARDGSVVVEINLR